MANVTNVESGGVGERVCIDLTERLIEREGMLIGSSANALVLIHGETIPSEFVPSRPFRVNAGAVHAYCLMADGSTKYLSELTAGDRVAIANPSNEIRSATIGRLKIERRPFLLVHFESAIINRHKFSCNRPKLYASSMKKETSALPQSRTEIKSQYDFHQVCATSVVK